VEWGAMWMLLRDEDPSKTRIACFMICSFLVLLQVIAMCLAPFFPVVEGNTYSIWYSIDIWAISLVFFF